MRLFRVATACAVLVLGCGAAARSATTITDFDSSYVSLGELAGSADQFGGAGALEAREADGLAPSALAPEPANWALMILGVAGMGFSLRRSRRPARTGNFVTDFA